MKGGIDSGLGRWGASEEGIPFGCDSSFSKRVAHVAKNVFLPDVRGRCCQIFIETSNGAHLHSAFFTSLRVNEKKNGNGNQVTSRTRRGSRSREEEERNVSEEDEFEWED